MQVRKTPHLLSKPALSTKPVRTHSMAQPVLKEPYQTFVAMDFHGIRRTICLSSRNAMSAVQDMCNSRPSARDSCIDWESSQEADADRLSPYLEEAENLLCDFEVHGHTFVPDASFHASNACFVDDASCMPSHESPLFLNYTHHHSSYLLTTSLLLRSRGFASR
jgi:hypothetical protein